MFDISSHDPLVERWYEAVADALHFIGKRWWDDTSPREDAFILHWADREAPRPLNERDGW